MPGVLLAVRRVADAARVAARRARAPAVRMIRRATPADARAIAEVQVRSWRRDYADIVARRGAGRG